ncbi:hypothetical protein LCGC14_3137080, partial [marine sediment metagenome]
MDAILILLKKKKKKVSNDKTKSNYIRTRSLWCSVLATQRSLVRIQPPLPRLLGLGSDYPVFLFNEAWSALCYDYKPMGLHFPSLKNNDENWSETMKRTIQIKVDGIECEATLNNSRTAEAIWEALPIVASINTWGDEVYFAIPVKLELEEGQELVAVGDLGYWPTGSAFCIFF